MANHAVKTKLSTSKFKTEIKSAYSIYLDSFAPTGRKSMKTLLQQCASILDHEKPIERFGWSTLTFEKVNLIRSVFTEAGYAVSSINLTLAGLKGVAKTAFNLGQQQLTLLMYRRVSIPREKDQKIVSLAKAVNIAHSRFTS